MIKKLSSGGDLYEAEELFRMEHKVECSRLYLLHYPDGKVYEPVPKAKGRYFGEPIYDHGAVAILMVDFEVKFITVEAAQNGRMDVSLKGKVRTILLLWRGL